MTLLIITYRYDAKVKATQDRMKELGLLPSDLSAYLSLDEWEIPRDQVVLNRRLGEGAFGTVYGGEAYFPTDGWLAVAVKTLKIGASIEEKVGCIFRVQSTTGQRSFKLKKSY